MTPPSTPPLTPPMTPPMTPRRIILVTALTFSVAAATTGHPYEKQDVCELEVSAPEVTPALEPEPLTPEQQFTRALGDHTGLVRVTPATGIDAVCDEYLEDRFGIKTIVLPTEDKEVRRLSREHNAQRRKQLMANIGPDKWRRTMNHAAIEAARRDIKNHRLRLVVVGMPMPADDEYARIMSNRYHIKIDFAGCIPPGEYDVELYNMLMRTEIDRRFGKLAMARTQEEAHARWQAQSATRYTTVDETAEPDAR